ncbi:MAG: HAMP domain-containing histidine kinase [Lachnospiraceae bacterium]|nr:HAMP domain-containing histidine kinase [Lachnospiraceae bacterium]
MRRETKERIKKIILPCLLFAVAAILIYLGVFGLALREYKKKTNAQMAAFIESVSQENDALSEAELVELYRKSATQESSLAGKYGYDDERFMNAVAGTFARKVVWLGIAVIVLLAVAFGLYLLHLQKKRERDLQVLIKYLHEISRKVYQLSPKENAEDEFSLLSNEIYKIAVLLKETSDNSQKDAENLSRALADISHQLKTPLSAIGILLDNILEDPEMPEEIRQDFLKSMDQQVTRISELVETLLSLARFDAGTVKMNPEPMRVGDLVDEALSELAILLDVSDVAVETTGDLDFSLLLDRRWEREAIKNIVKNAAEHSKPGTMIHVNGADCGMYYVLKIRDEGEGIASEDLPHIFERFYKAKNASASSVGIGLSLAKTVVEAEEGYLNAESETGKGTTFTIRWRVR